MLLLGNGSAAAPPGPATGSDVAADVLQRGLDLYTAQCAVCHGTRGDGSGMAAHMLRVQPRDFRRGLFKFRSTPSGSLPTDDDLLRTVTEGVRWTGMVGRPDLWEGDRRAVVQYLETFSARFASERSASRVAVPPAREKNSAKSSRSWR